MVDEHMQPPQRACEPAQASTREDIERLQVAVSQMPQQEVPTTHTFADGIYVRQMRVKAGCVIVGKVHRQLHAFILQKGEMVLTGDGQDSRRVKAPAMMVSQPGVKRAAVALTDCVVTNVHIADLTDIAAIEREQTEPDPTALFDAYNHLKALKHDS
jgi:hypothetical protein